MQLNYLSLFTGVGGGDLAFQHLLDGFRCVGYVENESYAQDVIRQRIEDGLLDCAPVFGDIRNLMVDINGNLLYIENTGGVTMGQKRNPKYDEAVNLYNKGLSIQDCADFFGITRQAMHKILKRRGVNFRPNLRFGDENHFFRNGKKTACDRSQNLLEKALEKGIVKRKTHCEICNDTGEFKDGRTKIQAHHDDYNKPLEVRWLCQKCHHNWHKEHKAIEIKEGKEEPNADDIDLVMAGFP